MNTMKKYAYLTPELVIAPRVTSKLLRILKAQGVKSVVSSGRETDTALGDMVSARVGKMARSHGLEHLHIPPSEECFQVFADAIRELPKPVLAISEHGSQAAALWTQVAADTAGADGITAAMERAGYDLSETDPGQSGESEPLAA
jgi:sulfide:quinone oxidoreductase